MNVFEHSQASALDGVLADLLDLGLLTRHARWNVIGSQFQAAQTLLRGVDELARGASDRVAERSITLGHSPDGRAATVTRLSSLPDIAPGVQHDDDTFAAFIALFDALTSRMHSACEAFDEDPVTSDILTDVLAEIERHSWMFRAQRED
jgi:starvation-inducible DNA-binding protein